MYDGLGVEWPSLGTAGALGDAHVVDGLREASELDRRRREVEAALLVGQIDQRQLYENDGMRTAKSWCRGALRWTPAEATRMTRVARLLRTHAETLPVEDAIRLPIGHLGEIARAAANPRCNDQIDSVLPVFLYWGEQLDFAAFIQVVRRWEQLADEDGTADAHERAHANRHVSMLPGEAGGSLSGSFGAMQMSVLSDVIEHFAKAEWLADWEWVKGTYGDAATPDKMPRTAAQRRADALVKMALRAMSMPLDAKGPVPTIFYVSDEESFLAATRRAGRAIADDFMPEPPTAHEPGNDADVDLDEVDEVDDFDVVEADESVDESVDGDPLADDEPDSETMRTRREWSRDDPLRRRCQSMSGIPLDPADVFAAAVVGKVRRVVIDAKGVIIDVGHRRRCFTGPMRDALLAISGRCDWIGCDTKNLEADHLKPWGQQGPTALSNGGTPCRWHNNAKNRCYLARRDDDGTWRYYRPDGSEIIPV